ncbi:GDP-mannose mannosyl hydrolase [Alteromonas aestuariivivens]|uniref:GDP-mannose mannosyl hydrolase n=1 Tax=Alteromonas aestuariivivens TaxID=1938339 RepID=A0A3D8M3I4_9ALTE|nr:GDP-mannose mannosyl hydrolase [Alteromonas aestuariivivens]RDV24160.1 GDP-mannose mannosyl hydrolase [Alteromonas aestuariivivens]
MFLDKQRFIDVLESTPLVSIDLVIRNRNDFVLLGKRVNRPAQGYWFVPGGRIYKNEPLKQAFKRLTQAEVGQTLEISGASLLGVYDHFYADCVFNEEVSTHYVAIAYSLKLESVSELPLEQHSDYRWMPIDELLEADDVHEHTKAYFR